MDIGRVELNAKDLMAQCTVAVHMKGTRAAIWRLRIARAIVSLAGKVAGAGIRIVEE